LAAAEKSLFGTRTGAANAVPAIPIALRKRAPARSNPRKIPAFDRANSLRSWIAEDDWVIFDPRTDS
jgi:hypothetical protein